jgi:hypothetical protein
LLLLNGELAADQSRHWAQRLRSQHGSDLPALVNAAYQQAFGRSAATDEVEAAMAFIRAQSQPDNDTIADYCHALMNANEFIYVD